MSHGEFAHRSSEARTETFSTSRRATGCAGGVGDGAVADEPHAPLHTQANSATMTPGRNDDLFVDSTGWILALRVNEDLAGVVA